jgi:HTH-type transcriptional regulator / antitoxin HigA
VSELVDADPAPGTPEGDHLEILSMLVERYENEHFPLHVPDPILDLANDRLSQLNK